VSSSRFGAPQGPPRRRRRRPRRGTLERPVNGQLYRSAFLLVSLPLLLAAFSVSRVGALQRPLLPPAFDARSTLALATELAQRYPNRVPGSAGDLGAAQWFAVQLQSFGLPTATDTWEQEVQGLGRVKLHNVVAVAPATPEASPDAIVVLAHHDATAAGPGANDNASGTAALVELARAYARPKSAAQAAVESAHTLLFVSTDGGSYGGVGAVRFLEHTQYHIVAVVNLDAIAGDGSPRIILSGDRPRSPAGTLVATTAARVLEQTGSTPRHAGFFGQLIDLGFPLSLYEQGPFVAAGIPAITLTTGGNRPPPAVNDTISALNEKAFVRLGRASQELLGSLNQSLELEHGTTPFVFVGDRQIRGWAIELVLIALLLPYLVAVVDLYALCRRMRIPLLAAGKALRNRLVFWFVVAAVFTCFRWLGAWPSGPPRPPNPELPLTGNWPVLVLVGFAVVVGLAWIVERDRLVPRRAIDPAELLAGETAALLALGVVALLVVATNPFALLFVLPALHLWLWLPQLRTSGPWTRLGLFAAGLLGPGLVLISLGWRYGLGFDAPWYLLQLVSVGYVKATAALVAIAGAAPAAQLATAAAGRYAPYPGRDERRPRGPIRALVRTIVLGLRARRREADRRRAVG
jgi:Peptidase family M28